MSLMSDGATQKRLVACVAAALRATGAYPREREALRAIFRKPSLQLVSLTITEKGYSILDLCGEPAPDIRADIERGPGNCSHAMAILASLLLDRYAAVSMDNCSRNGERLRASVLRVAQEWRAAGCRRVSSSG